MPAELWRMPAKDQLPAPTRAAHRQRRFDRTRISSHEYRKVVFKSPWIRVFVLPVVGLEG
jgi:hypothetical protein